MRAPWSNTHTPPCNLWPDANIIIDSSEGRHQVAGVIDFGDMVHTWRVNEVAIAVAYAMLSTWGQQEGNHILAAVALLRGLAEVEQLHRQEVGLLRTLVACRLACSYTFGMFSYSQDPSNEYLLHHAAPAGRALEVSSKFNR